METQTEFRVVHEERFLMKALDKSISYGEYRERVRDYAKRQSNSGPEKTPALAGYTQLNDKRMNRWDKTLVLPASVQHDLAELKYGIIWLVMTESWCGDASPSLPVMNKFAQESNHIDLRIVFRDNHPELMDVFLTNGARSIPKLIALNAESLEVLGQWGPRSTKATAMVLAEKEKQGKLSAEFKQQLQVFYNKDKGMDIIDDLIKLLRGIQ